MASFTIYVKHKGGDKALIDKAIALLNAYLPKVVAKNTNFGGGDARYVDDSTSPTLLDTDVIVYVVRNISKSVISKQSGSVAVAEADTSIMGLTDLNKKICEVYFDRIYQDSSKELAGAIYHEAAHIKSNMDNAMHTNRDGFLKAKPDYYGDPTDDNNTFFGGHLGRKVTMTASY
jgi:hypothetical protein